EAGQNPAANAAGSPTAEGPYSPFIPHPPPMEPKTLKGSRQSAAVLGGVFSLRGLWRGPALPAAARAARGPSPPSRAPPPAPPLRGSEPAGPSEWPVARGRATGDRRSPRPTPRVFAGPCRL